MGRHRNVKIINNCQLKYKPDQIHVTQKILKKVPDKYLVGLGEIIFYDDEKYPNVKYVKGKPFSKQSRIEVFMGGVASSQKYSLMHFNIAINPIIVNHIVSYLQPNSNDKAILSYRNGRYDPNWLYLGIWSPLLTPINLGRFLYNKVPAFRSFLDKKIKQLLNKYT